MILIQGATLYAPDFQGKKDLLTGGGKILAIADSLKPDPALDIQLIDGTGQNVVPGIVDAHVHIAGAGGEGGPASRTPEMPLSYLLEGGVTTAIGCLGTDGFTRSQESVLMKVKALRSEGVSAWMYAGAYQIPAPTLTGEIGRDIALIEEVIGAGEIALSDHRSSHPTLKDLITFTEHVRVGGMLGGKAGIVNIHMGDAQKPFAMLLQAAEQSELPLKQFYPTHINRNTHILEDAKTYGKEGWLDLTASSYEVFPDIEVKPGKAIRALLEAGVPLEHITMTSDANGSLPDFDEKGNLRRLAFGKPVSVLNELRDAVLQEQLPLEKAVRIVTRNPATILKLPGKGQIAKGMDADLLLLDDGLHLQTVIAKGQLMMHEGKLLAKGTYE